MNDVASNVSLSSIDRLAFESRPCFLTVYLEKITVT